MLVFVAFSCLLTVSGRTIHLPHVLSGNIFHQGLHGHNIHSAHLTSGLWHYFLTHSLHSSGGHHTQITNQEVITPQGNNTQDAIRPQPQPTQGTTVPEIPKPPSEIGIPGAGTDHSMTAVGTDERQRFDRWKDKWLLEHLSSCGDQPIEPVFPTHRIIGGGLAVEGSWPWMVSFFSKRIQQHVCAGTIIDRQWIVSAAHCFVEFQLVFHLDIKDDLEVRVGLYNNTANTKDQHIHTYHAVRILIHPEFELEVMDNDIALVRLGRPVSFNDFIQPVCLFGQDAKEQDTCIITGWGRQKQPEAVSAGLPKLDPSAWPGILKQASVPVIDHTGCSNLYKDKLTSHMICAGYLDGSADSCNGDSGGPLLCQTTQDGRWALTGITSWGGLDHKGCAGTDQPGVYTKVSGYYEWVLSSMYSNRD
ncbi:prostasin-like [Ylistrum balloti]|uniref:prostasin-like n=1 Tax=Ylistrum balloti TaxID=509963 RepID=UPI002905AB8D|nr:prostasin-like [Ylistrum balloti]